MAQETIQLPGGLRLGKREATQIGAAVGFASIYSAFESLYLEDYLKNITDPIPGTQIFPYHVFAMFPAFLTASLAIGHDPRLLKNFLDGNAWFRTILNVLQIFPPLVVMEDILYFIIQGFDRSHPETYGKHNIVMDDWTCQHLKLGDEQGCIDLGFTALPKWYLAAGGTAVGSWIVDNILLPEGKPLLTI